MPAPARDERQRHAAEKCARGIRSRNDLRLVMRLSGPAQAAYGAALSGRGFPPVQRRSESKEAWAINRRQPAAVECRTSRCQHLKIWSSRPPELACAGHPGGRTRRRPSAGWPTEAWEFRTAARVLPPKLAVGLADVEPAAGEQTCNSRRSGPRRRALMPRPSLHQGTAATQPVGEMADGERIGLGTGLLSAG